ncbi:hypothetical protein HDU77_007167 [Chytriomyces hyalinus]|nr:hypothetical protein HDU77_007167 [Chytriomyces hyalinus]
MALLPSPTNWLHAFPPSPPNTRSDRTSTTSTTSSASAARSSSSYPRTRYQVGQSSHDSLTSAVEALMRQDTEYNNQATTTTTTDGVVVDKGVVVSPISFARVTLPDVAGAQSTLRMGSTAGSLDRGLRVVGSARDDGTESSSSCTRKGRFEVRRL